ncbi:pyridoxal phosphate-dependent transferase [Stachybotrys elegans]|uniref:Pyridoxal phosphate-dependent transferase n=1 Tax=Stachybotrys elegans TaxID=80388 RepID=A0A8K0SII4_9HYPO|nr:pyridoxal phosphate-dependent transferase [Stachybotrys elegans]
MSSKFSVEKARAAFPALASPQIFGDNAGGSQVLGTVAERMRRSNKPCTNSISTYLIKTNVQLGASYPASQQSTALYSAGYKAAAKYVNAHEDEIVLGASATQVLFNLAASLKFNADDEVIVSELDHESNIDPWLYYARRTGFKIKWWTSSDPKNPMLELDTLKGLLTEKTRLVAFTHSSNILGHIHDVRAIANEVHKIPGAMICVDAVAYAPHRLIDVKQLGADFYVFSWYKVYGPHMALLYGSMAAQEQMDSLGHYFNPSNTLSSKLGLAASNYELLQSLVPLVEYFGDDPAEMWAGIEKHEETLQKRLIDYISSRPDITIRGEPSPDTSRRLPTISFTVEGRSSRSIVEAMESISNVGIRWGHFYSKRLVEKVLGLEGDGVVRVSLVHYNTSKHSLHEVVFWKLTCIAS